jgi:hypothetical protein
MATAFRANAAEAGKRLIAAAQLMPADKYDFKPTPARLTQSFAFCDTALASLDDSRLGETFSLFGRNWSRAAMETRAISDWADHYSQLAIYLRLNGLLPPTAKQ